MNMRNVRKLHRGDQVTWTDPDAGICSRTLTILEIEVKGEAVCITDEQGDYLEALPRELS